MIATIPKPQRRAKQPRKPIRTRKPLGWRRREAKRFPVDPDTLDAIAAFYHQTCAYCEREPAEQWDHLEPIAHGGENRASNIVTACTRCNMNKGRLHWLPRRQHPYA